MTLYNTFIGIDIGKFNFVVSVYNTQLIQEYENTSSGIAQFIKDHIDISAKSLCIVETTGGYELELLYTMVANNYRIHRADTRKVKNFIRSYGNCVKTDALDAKALALYGYERHEKLELFKLQSEDELKLFRLVQRRGDLNSMLVAEQNRFQSPAMKEVKSYVKEIITALKEQLKKVSEEIQSLIDANPVLKNKQKILKTVPGIGNLVAFELLILLPEIGRLCRRKIASLAGVAPRANESGKFIGYRRTGYGRLGIKRILFLAAMAARNSKTHLKEFYEKLVAKGKKKMVALTALMRKILIIANARLRDFYSA